MAETTDSVLRHSDLLYRTLAANLPDTMVVIVDGDQRVVLIDGDYPRAWTWLAPRAMVGRSVEELGHVVPQGILGTVGPAFEAALEGERSRFDLVEGPVTLAVQIVPVRDDAGEICAALGVGHDVTEQRATERHHREQAAIVASSGDSIISTTLDGTIVSANAGATRVFGYPTEELIGRPISIIYPAREADRKRRLMERVAEGEAVVGFESIGLRKDGSEFPASMTVSPVIGEGGRVVGLSGVVRDISDRKRLEAALERQALTDDLTGLPNRRLLMRWLYDAIVAGADPAVILFSVEDVQSVNDSLGYIAGDQVLFEVGRRLDRITSADDMAARLGSTEFVLALRDVGDTPIEEVAERALTRLGVPVGIAGRAVGLQVRAGIATAATSPTPSDLLRDADAALAAARSGCTARFRVFEPTMHERALERFELAADLRRALARGEIYVAYQPVISLTTGRVRGFEALCRWDHPVRGPVSPEAFISVAEDTGQIVALGDFVLDEALAQVAELHRFDPSLYVAVNASPFQFRNPGFAPAVLDRVAAAGIDPGTLMLEVTESGVMGGLDAALASLQVIREAGCQVAVDDFGTGYSSIAYLRHLPVDTVKIDRSLLPDENGTEHEWALMAAILDLVGAVDKDSIIEGVETGEQAERVAALGATLAQGFHLARPLRAEDLLAWLRGRDSNSQPNG